MQISPSMTYFKKSFKGKRLETEDLEYCTFQECDFSGSLLDRCVVAGAAFEGCDLRDATFGECDLSDARFTYCPMSNFRAIRCIGSRLSFVGCKLSSASLKLHVVRDHMVFSKCKMAGSSILVGASDPILFSRCSLSDTRLFTEDKACVAMVSKCKVDGSKLTYALPVSRDNAVWLDRYSTLVATPELC